jgi:CDP-glucose 4,6-dehydratase
VGRRQGALEDLVMAGDFWRRRRVLVTGHTGFKGAWLTRWLGRLGAEVHALALAPATTPNLHALLAPTSRMRSHVADIRDPAALARIVAEADPEVVFHLAAQSLVPEGYRAPVETFDVNVLGTVRLLAALAGRPGLRAVLVATSDKVYANADLGRAFAEGDPLGGDDPYSASKAACEIAVAGWRASFAAGGPPIVTARAGNVIGGGDWSADRLVPDLVRAIGGDTPLVLRRPTARRPWQHVLDPLAGYLAYAERLAAGERLPPGAQFRAAAGSDVRGDQAGGRALPQSRPPAADHRRRRRSDRREAFAGAGFTLGAAGIELAAAHEPRHGAGVDGRVVCRPRGRCRRGPADRRAD